MAIWGEKSAQGDFFFIAKDFCFLLVLLYFSVSSMLFEAFKRKKSQISVTLEDFEIVGLCCQKQRNKLIYSNLAS